MMFNLLEVLGSMKKKSIIFGSVFIIFLLMMSSFFVGAITLNKHANSTYLTSILDENDADLPIWTIGDSWTYNVEIEGEQNEYFDLEFDLYIDNMEFEVVEIQAEMYKLSMIVPEGDFNGAVTADLGAFTFSGNIEDAYLDGFMYVKKSTLGIQKCEGSIVGDTNKLILPHFDIDFQIEFEVEENNQGVKTNFSSLMFPMNIEDTWLIPQTYLNISINAVQPNLGQNRLFSYVYGHEATCIGWDTLQLGNNNYDALKISGVNNGDVNDVWYSAAAGNIIKIDYQNVALGFGYILNTLTFDLVSTTFESTSNPPEMPITPTGPTDVLVGESGDYVTSSVDPDGNNIRYIVDWDDGSAMTFSDFIESGETYTASHQWNTKGNHEMRIKARDKFGKESKWSETLTVTVINNNPNKPSIPDGPTSGKIKNSYTYSTTSTDPDSHQLKYGFDWDGDDQVDDWTSLVDSGESASKSHAWTTQGNYEIKVKAQDEYGEESEWSDPLSISMPKNKIISCYLLKILEQHLPLSLLIQYIQQIL